MVHNNACSTYVREEKCVTESSISGKDGVWGGVGWGDSCAHPCLSTHIATEEGIQQRPIQDSDSTCVGQPVRKWNQAHVPNRQSEIFPCWRGENVKLFMVEIHSRNIRSGPCGTIENSNSYRGVLDFWLTSDVAFWFPSKRRKKWGKRKVFYFLVLSLKLCIFTSKLNSVSVRVSKLLTCAVNSETVYLTLFCPRWKQRLHLFSRDGVGFL